VAVPEDEGGDQVLAVAEVAPGETFDPVAFGEFLDDQPDLGTKWAPAFVRLVPALPRTPSNKVIKRRLDLTVSQGLPDLWRREAGPSSRTYLPA
jgi:fatty-acyl-CoA synthase